ncbi:hypothetical protein K502DRAFT_352835 [Neoconidiobolus thromboides FSU 785]|nr:hypothetical protein K502DRAFT_352835 [Neoconidiobolus thromboides FSU 785]
MRIKEGKNSVLIQQDDLKGSNDSVAISVDANCNGNGWMLKVKRGSIVNEGNDAMTSVFIYAFLPKNDEIKYTESGLASHNTTMTKDIYDSITKKAEKINDKILV